MQFHKWINHRIYSTLFFKVFMDKKIFSEQSNSWLSSFPWLHSLLMCTAAFFTCTVVLFYFIFSKVVKFYSGSLSTACWKMPSMEDELITPLIFGSYAPISSSSSPHDSSPPPQLDRGRVKEAHVFSPLRSASQTLALYWYVFEIRVIYTHRRQRQFMLQPKLWVTE